MIKLLLVKIKESVLSVFPVSLIVIILNFTPIINLTSKEIITFSICSIFLIIGISLFTLGSDVAMTPMGEQVGSGLSKTKKLSILLIVCYFLGFLITVAEPDLSVLASQVGSKQLVIFVGLGVGLFLVLAVLKIVFKRNLASLLMYFYMILFALSLLLPNSNLIPLAFDSGGVTTGPITVPFIMALGVGIAYTIGGKNTNENSFGLISLCSVGPILAVIILNIFSSSEISAPNSNDYVMADNLFASTLSTLLRVSKEVSIALGLVIAFFFIINFIFLKLPKKKLLQIIIGTSFTFVGLILFLTAVSVGFMPIGFKMGQQLAKFNPYLLTIIGFILGLVVVLAEPAVHVLKKQVEDITDGIVSRKSMLIALSIGVGLSIGLSMIRIYFGFSILYYLIPGYLISLGLSFFVPRMYTAIAFDSGGVASGPLTSTFILPFAIGACMEIYSSNSNAVLSYGFGIVAMVAMTPLITIQLLGFRAVLSKRIREKIAMRRILTSDDKQIIEFM